MKTNNSAVSIPARAALDLMPADNVMNMLRACYHAIRHNAALAYDDPRSYHIPPEMLDAVSLDEAIAPAWIALEESIRAAENDPSDPRRDRPLARFAVAAMCMAIRSTYRAEHRRPSAVFYLDAAEPETAAAVIDTALHADRIPGPEDSYIMRETISDALEKSCRNDADRAVIALTAYGYSDSRIAAQLDTTRNAVRLTRKRIRERATTRLELWEEEIVRTYLAPVQIDRESAETVSEWIAEAGYALSDHTAG